MLLLHQEVFPQETFQGWQEGNEGGRPQIRPAARFGIQGKGNVSFFYSHHEKVGEI